MRIAVLALVTVAAAGCGGQSRVDAADLRACLEKRVAPPTRVGTEEGVTTLSWEQPDGTETIASVFPSAGDAQAAEESEARLGDAHDRRARNVLYSGGGAVEAAIRACLS